MSSTDAMTARKTAATRLAIGLAQGIALFLLQKADESKAWPATVPMLYAPLLVCALMVPMIPLAALSAMRRAALIAWTVLATGLTAVLAVHAAWTGAEPQRLGAGPLSPPIFIAAAALLFIAHHLVQPADAARKPVAPYADYFDLAFTNLIRLFLSLAFTGAFWLLLFLAGALFKLIGVQAIQKLIGETAFAFPATGLMFAAAGHMAVQLTEARAGLVRGVRTVGLTLLAWLSPLMVVIAGGFLATLPFTGLAPLWGTKAATSLLLSAAAALIILVNAAYQDGVEPPSTIPRWAARIAGLLLIPIVILATYALWLRVDQYGLTPDRVFAGAYLVVAIGFTIGYAFAALKPGSWMKILEPTNLIMAAVSVLLLLALFTPIADPARLSVNSQVKRLERGKVAAEKFDFQFLRFDSGRYGRLALERLKAHPDAEVAKRAREASASTEKRYAASEARPNFKAMAVYPVGKALPKSFIAQDWSKPSGSNCTGAAMQCPALVADVDADGRDEVLLAEGDRLKVFSEGADHTWSLTAIALAGCESYDLETWMKAGPPALGEPVAHRDLILDGRRLPLQPASKDCQASGASAAPPKDGAVGADKK